jgi:phage terminase large subunit-like protein
MEAKSTAEKIALLPEQERRSAIRSLSQKEAEALLFDWEFWARPNQLPPSGDWLVWLIMAGRGFGKTRSAAEFVNSEVKAGRAGRVALVAKTPADARDVMVEGESGILNVSPPWFKPEYESSKRRLTWPNGAIATVYSSKEPDHLNGPQHDLCFVAGTMVATPQGERSIENIKPGDYVLTRLGARRVTANLMHEDEVGRVIFSNCAELVATVRHCMWSAKVGQLAN